MRAFSVAFLATVFALPAAAQEFTESAADVEFVAAQELYRGTDVSFRIPADTALGFRLTANVSADIEAEMQAESHVLWPESMTQSWMGVPGGGEVAVILDLVASAEVGLFAPIEIAGFTYDPTNNGANPSGLSYALWTESWQWTKFTLFDSLLLPGAPQQSVGVAIDASSGAAFSYPIELDFEIPLIAGYTLEPGGSFDINPDALITITGSRVTTRGREVITYDGEAVIPAPNVNDGTAQYESMWVGEATSTFGLVAEITPDLSVYDGDGVRSGFSDTINGLIGSFLEYPISIASDTRAIQSRNTAYTHDLPAMDTDHSSLDFGTVDVGTESQLNLTIENLGAIELWGDIAVEGEGFSISRPDMEVDGDGDMTLTVTFSPSEAGSASGQILLSGNDPVNDAMAIPLTGNGFEEGVDPVDTGDVDGPDGEAGIRGCGCSSAPTGGLAWLALIPAFGFVLRRRR